jgi:mannose-6-phosphate isomerase-like protein (cupin superfamily)
VRLADQEARAATGARQFRLVTDPTVGCPSATQFIGTIPPGRAPDHFHGYDEVIYVLDGEGILHIGALHEPIGRGSCIHLTPRLVHSLENTGGSTLRVLGIFRPAGSPAEAYYPDGTLAYDYRSGDGQ